MVEEGDDLFSLSIDDRELGDYSSLAAVWEEIERAYQNLQDSYAGVVAWRIEDKEHNRMASEELAAGLWYAMAEDSDKFEMWLEMSVWQSEGS